MGKGAEGQGHKGAAGEGMLNRAMSYQRSANKYYFPFFLIAES